MLVLVVVVVAPSFLLNSLYCTSIDAVVGCSLFSPVPVWKEVLSDATTSTRL